VAAAVDTVLLLQLRARRHRGIRNARADEHENGSKAQQHSSVKHDLSFRSVVAWATRQRLTGGPRTLGRAVGTNGGRTSTGVAPTCCAVGIQFVGGDADSAPTPAIFTDRV
jgi:hypothetical protein